MTFCFFDVFVRLNQYKLISEEAGLHINTQEGGGIKTVLYLPDVGSYSTDLSIGVLSYYKLVKDLIEKISKNSSSSTRFILLIFSTRYFNSNISLPVIIPVDKSAVLYLFTNASFNA